MGGAARYDRTMTIDAARRLRKQPTDAEMRLWSRLRRRQVGGHRFRRQVPVGPFVVDSACLEARLVIEVDGGQHVGSERDAVRTEWLEGQGFRILRFWNDEVLRSTDDVVEAVRSALG
jgi:very-short-patch-repair endonuclease